MGLLLPEPDIAGEGPLPDLWYVLGSFWWGCGYAPWAAPNLFLFVMSKGPAADNFLLDKKLRGEFIKCF